ncbi:MAG: 1,4-alpha-glucan branching protein domain-containing protein [Chloroflexota bacterium]
MHSGNYVLILHTHLPWALNHGAWPHGSDWVCEAVAECYIPLINMFNRLLSEGISPKVTLDISPVNCEQIENEEFKKLYVEYCDAKIAGARRDEEEFRSRGYSAHQIWLATYWAQWYEDRKSDFINRYDRSIIGALRKLQDEGAIEIMTCGATHGYSPLLGYDESVNLQFEAAYHNYKKHFGRAPRGTWLPECAYRPSYDWHSYLPIEPFHKPHLRPGVEQIIARYGLKYFVADEKLLENSYPLGAFLDDSKEKFIPISSPAFEHKPWNFDKSPLRVYEISSSERTEYGTAAAFFRHMKLSMQVWAGIIGYPGEPDYLDFHKKQHGSFLRYWRVTDSKTDMMYKSLYYPDSVHHKTDLQANHYIHHIENTVNYFRNMTGLFGTLCNPFDTELFGHWWFEGPEFLYNVIKGLHNSPYVNMATASEQLIITSPKEVIRLGEGSWGENQNHDVWSNEENKWTWEAIYNNENRLKGIYNSYPPAKVEGMARRILTQALRELMLMQASDWQFLIHTKSAKDYAEQRFSFHHSDFNRLCNVFEEYTKTGNISQEEENNLVDCEKRNAVFPELQLEWWRY